MTIVLSGAPGSVAAATARQSLSLAPPSSTTDFGDSAEFSPTRFLSAEKPRFLPAANGKLSLSSSS
eukprot:CAMPEP_0115113954 /NCGR_PEP_ID=MMETSP0227-20121206/41738_1 /TAXON_ID=89957 /ORGANISM="Polarella glacialis, Strain CCMP 1383" /LENGTH=65 /DNA_ID=CAMNT_0002514201 /DNA_START=216 /DNA_END=410 /DNA_ORIENTATION=+